MSKKTETGSFFRSFSLQNKGKKIRLNYLIIVLVAGVFLMLLGSYLNDDGEEEAVMNLEQPQDQHEAEETPVFKSEEDEESMIRDAYEDHYQQQLKEALEQIVGVSNVTVMIHTAGSEKNIYQTDSQHREQMTEETDSEGGTRKVQDTSDDEQAVIIRSGDKEEPLIVRTEKPEVTGVLVVANGVDNIQVKTWVVEAVSRGLDVPSHRVSVMPRKQKEDVS